MKGVVKWFDEKKGWGFVIADGGGKDVFVHQSSIKMLGRRFLVTGQQVQFDEIMSDKGREGKNVTVTGGVAGEVKGDVRHVVVELNLDAMRLSSKNHSVPLCELIYDAFDAAADKLVDELELPVSDTDEKD